MSSLLHSSKHCSKDHRSSSHPSSSQTLSTSPTSQRSSRSRSPFSKKTVYPEVQTVCEEFIKDRDSLPYNPKVPQSTAAELSRRFSALLDLSYKYPTGELRMQGVCPHHFEWYLSQFRTEEEKQATLESLKKEQEHISQLCRQINDITEEGPNKRWWCRGERSLTTPFTDEISHALNQRLKEERDTQAMSESIASSLGVLLNHVYGDEYCRDPDRCKANLLAEETDRPPSGEAPKPKKDAYAMVDYSYVSESWKKATER